MNTKSVFLNTHARRRRGISLLSLTMATVLGVFGAVATVNAQATAGSIFGKAPAGQTISAKSSTNGMQRHVKADAKGRYSLRSLPIGTYNVVLEKNGQPIVKHLNVNVMVGRGSEVDFDCAKNECGSE